MAKRRRKFTPMYQQLANVLRARIVSTTGDDPVQLPTEVELCQTHQSSRASIRQALDLLAAEGLIERAPRRGTLTVPAGIRVWRRLHQSRVIKVITSWGTSPSAPSSFYGRIYRKRSVNPVGAKSKSASGTRIALSV